MSYLRFFGFPRRLVGTMVGNIMFVITLVCRGVRVRGNIRLVTVVNDRRFVRFGSYTTTFTRDMGVVVARYFFTRFIRVFVRAQTMGVVLNTLVAHRGSRRDVNVQRTKDFTSGISGIRSRSICPLVGPPTRRFVGAISRVFIFPVRVRLLFKRGIRYPLVWVFVVVPDKTLRGQGPIVQQNFAHVHYVLPGVVVIVEVVL